MLEKISNPCDSVIIDGVKYGINTDFKIWIEIEHLFFDRSMGDAERLARVLALAYPVLPKNPVGAVKGVMFFYSAGKECETKNDETKLPFYDLKEDFGYVWGAFLNEFDIDLTTVNMHWWRFRALLCCLGDECRFSKIVGYRSIDTSGIKDAKQRRYYERMKKNFRLRFSFDEKVREKQLADSFENLF